MYKGAAALWTQQLARGHGDRRTLIRWLCVTLEAKEREPQPSTPSLAALFFATA